MFNSMLTPDNAKALLASAKLAHERTIRAYPARNAGPSVTAAYLRAVKLSGDTVAALARLAVKA